MPEMIARNAIHANPWNVNAFDPEMYPKLVASIRERGIMEPLKVMPDPEAPEVFLLIDGYHRWKAAGELEIGELPCEVWAGLSLEEAKIRGLQLNYLRGQPVPRRLAELVHDLNRQYEVPALAGMLPWSESELADALDLLRLPEDLAARLAEQAREQARESWAPWTVILQRKEADLVERAMSEARDRIGHNARKGQCMAHIAGTYLTAIGKAETVPETPQRGYNGDRDTPGERVPEGPEIG